MSATPTDEAAEPADEPPAAPAPAAPPPAEAVEAPATEPVQIERVQPEPFAALSDDAFLGGRLRLWQPVEGYRAATDPVLLAAACPARPGQSVLDLGAGAGAAALCLHVRVPALRLTGLEIQPSYAALSRRNAARAGAAWRVHEGDALRPPSALRAETFDHVLTNPPFFAADAGPPLDDPGRDRAHREQVPLGDWIDAALRRLKPFGALTVIQRAERVPEILAALAGRAGAIELIPLWPRPGRPAKRVLLRAVKESRGPFILRAGLVLHPEAGEGFTPEAEAILRDGAPFAP
ncbi:MAG: methyltransferase [Pseudomonadota bacterium]